MSRSILFLSAVFSSIQGLPPTPPPQEIALPQYEQEMAAAIRLAKEAGQIILDVRASGEELLIEWKEGKIPLPVTDADYRANDLICQGLIRLFPDSGILSQEKIDDPAVNRAIERWRSAESTWIIDPLDGTKNFIEGGDEFGVHIGLSYNGEPVVGVNYYPATKTAYFAAKGRGAWIQKGEEIPVQFKVEDRGMGIWPISNKNPLETRPIYEKLFGTTLSDETLFTQIGSAGLRICRIAQGERNLYITAGVRGAIWDFCSSEVILREAGGFVSDLFGNPIDYRSDNAKLKNGAIVCGSEELYQKVLRITAQ